MFDDIKELARRYLPPAAFCIIPMLMIWSLPNNTLMRWPIFGEFVMDSALKGLLMAIVWFLVFSVVIIYKLLFPSYPLEVRNRMNEVREKLYSIDETYNSALPWALLFRELKPFLPKVPRPHRGDFGEILRLIRDGESYYEDKKLLGDEIYPSERYPNLGLLMKKIMKFEKKTEWANNS